MSVQFARSSVRSTPVYFAHCDNWRSLATQLPEAVREAAQFRGFKAAAGEVLVAQAGGGARSKSGSRSGFVVVLGVAADDKGDPLLAGKLVGELPSGVYRFENTHPAGEKAQEAAALAWLMASYRFSRYGKSGPAFPQLVAPAGVDAARCQRLAESIHLARDLIMTPANDMGPSELAAQALAVARKYRARATVIRGEQLLRRNFPLIHAVGRAGADAPRLVDIVWGRARAPKVTLVGKGVCFDTGGLDIKPASAMLMMKKDMGGGAIALALARAIMDAKLDVRLRLLLPIVENSVAGNAFRPGDVYKSRKGITVEIGNTDAEGRLILADALALGEDDEPELMFDFATLTGAARVATGPDLPSFFCTDDTTAEAIVKTGLAAADPVWRMPLWQPYEAMLASKVADTNNVSSGAFAGAITAALFLKKFATKAKVWGHFDVYAWNASTRPGRPEGAEAQTLRLLYAYLEERFG